MRRNQNWTFFKQNKIKRIWRVSNILYLLYIFTENKNNRRLCVDYRYPGIEHKYILTCWRSNLLKLINSSKVFKSLNRSMSSWEVIRNSWEMRLTMVLKMRCWPHTNIMHWGAVLQSLFYNISLIIYLLMISA